MKIVILAGGFGTRINEESHLKPKPMIEIGGRPILWHIMKTYSHYGFNDFVICLGYKGYMMKEWFANYLLHNSDVTIKLKTNEIVVHNTQTDDWTVSLIDTGLNTQTGGRIKRIKDYINQNFTDPTLCTDSISTFIGFSSCYIRFTFKKVFDVSISGYINNIRLDYCKNQLDTTKYPIKKIYKSAGFYNYSYFFTLFKKEMGLTPNQYRFQKFNS